MTDPIQTPTFPSLLQRFFIEHLGQQRAVSPRTVTAYRDTFRLLLGFAEATIGKTPAVFTLADLDAKPILGFSIISRKPGRTRCAVAMPDWRHCDLF
jgi:integrase/recombinase XerD